MFADPDFDLGWCHACETFQRIEDAPVLRLWWIPDAVVTAHCCVVCGDSEPWPMGVWNAEKFTRDGTYTVAQLIALCSRQAVGHPGNVYPDIDPPWVDLERQRRASLRRLRRRRVA